MNAKLIFLFIIIFLFSFVSSLTLNQGIVLNTTLSNSSVNFSFSINVTNFTVEPNYILLNGINYTNVTESYNCSYVNHSSSNSVLDSSEFNCSIILETLEEIEEEAVVLSGGSSISIIRLNENDFKNETSKLVSKNSKITFPVKKEIHTLAPVEISRDFVIVTVSSEVQEKKMFVGDEWVVDVNLDGERDVSIILNSISNNLNFINVTIKEFKEETVVKEDIFEEDLQGEIGEDYGGEKTFIKEFLGWKIEGEEDNYRITRMTVLTVLVLLLGVISFVKFRKSNKKKKRYKKYGY